MNFNRTILGGNLTRDVEIVHTTGGQVVAKFGLAVNRKYTTASGEKREEVLFIDCEAWGKTAETIGQFMAKGRPMIAEGRLKMDQWEDKQTNQKRTKILLSVDGFSFADAPKSAGAPAASGESLVAAAKSPISDDSEIPF